MPEGPTTDLLTEFTRTNIDWLRRTTTARHASLSSEEWSQLAIVCEFLASLAKKHGDLARTALDRGIEAGALKVRLEPSMSFLGDAVQTMAELQQMGESASSDGGAIGDRIRKVHAEIEAVHADLASLLTLAEAEPPPVPEDLLAAAEAGPFIRLEEFAGTLSGRGYGLTRLDGERPASAGW